MKMSELLYYARARNKSFYDFLINERNTGNMIRSLPEIAVMDEYIHNPKHHPEGCTDDEYGTVLDHVLECVRIACDLNYSDREKVCVLFHDLGKIKTGANYTKDHLYHNFYGHENVGLGVLKCVSSRMEIEETLEREIAFCIHNHMRFHRIKEMRPFKVERMVKSPFWELLKKVSWCDEGSRKGNRNDFDSVVEYAERMM